MAVFIPDLLSQIPLARLGIGLGVVTALAAVMLFLREAPLRSRRMRLGLPVALVLLTVGLPGVVSPVLTLPRLRFALGAACVFAAAWLTHSARSAHRRYVRAALAPRAQRISDAQALLGASDEAQDVRLEGRLAADPPIIAPISRRPCVVFRLEVRRAQSGSRVAQDLVSLEESEADRLVLRDATGQAALTGSPKALTRGATLDEAVVEGVVDMAEVTSSEPTGRLARLVWQFDPDPPGEGSCAYRFIEKSLPDLRWVSAAGSLRRQAGEATFLPMEGRLQMAENRDAVTTLRSEAIERGALAVAAAVIGSLWLWP
jgi:hypothetical protein